MSKKALRDARRAAMETNVEAAISGLRGVKLRNKDVAEVLALLDPEAPFTVSNDFECIGSCSSTGRNLTINADGGLDVNFHPQ